GASSPPPVGTATPTPPPTPLATPDTLFSCAIGDGSASSSCLRENPSFLNEVNTAIDQLVQQQPQIFDLGNALGDGGYKVLSPGQYYVGVMRNLQHMGFCANFDGEEMQVKNTNEFSDQYHIMISSGYVRRGSSSYRATCYPAAFPVGGNGLP